MRFGQSDDIPGLVVSELVLNCLAKAEDEHSLMLNLTHLCVQKGWIKKDQHYYYYIAAITGKYFSVCVTKLVSAYYLHPSTHESFFYIKIYYVMARISCN